MHTCDKLHTPSFDNFVYKDCSASEMFCGTGGGVYGYYPIDLYGALSRV